MGGGASSVYFAEGECNCQEISRWLTCHQFPSPAAKISTFLTNGAPCCSEWLLSQPTAGAWVWFVTFRLQHNLPFTKEHQCRHTDLRNKCLSCSTIGWYPGLHTIIHCRRWMPWPLRCPVMFSQSNYLIQMWLGFIIELFGGTFIQSILRNGSNYLSKCIF